MQWTKTGTSYVSNNGYTLTKTPGKRWVVSYGNETLIGGQQFRQLSATQDAAKFDSNGRGLMPTEPPYEDPKPLPSDHYEEDVTPVVVPMPPEPDQPKPDSDDDGDGEDTPLHPQTNPEPEPALPGHDPEHGEPNFASDPPAVAQVTFSPLKRQFAHPNDPLASGAVYERLEMYRDLGFGFGVQFKVGSGTRGIWNPDGKLWFSK